jgi:hypothetical protein
MTDAPSTPVVATTSSVQPREYLSFFAAMRAVVWSFVGLRSSNGSRLDVSQIKPLHFVVAGFLSLFVMIFSLVLLVTQVIL